MSSNHDLDCRGAVGRPNHWFRYLSLLSAALIVGGSWMNAIAQTNSWTKPTSGNWEELFWSLGVLPNSTQSIEIVNPGFKAVAVNPATAQNFPDSLTVSSLLVAGSGLNTLLLNFAGTAVPLHVLNDLAVGDGGRIVSFHSGLVVGGRLWMTNSEFIQEGGLVAATNAGIVLVNSAYQMTNGVFEGGHVLIGLDYFSTFNQYGGTATIRSLDFVGSFSMTGGGMYSLYGGTANFPAGLRVNSDAGNRAGFLQAGGSNSVASLSVLSGLNGVDASYILNEGFLGASNVSVLAGGTSATFIQNGGVHVITNALEIEGGIRAFNPPNVQRATYVQDNGTLQVRTIIVRTIGRFVQSNGVTLVSGTLSLGGSTIRWDSSLLGGTLGCSNVAYSGIGANFLQAGGSFIVTNTLSFGGEGAPFSESLPTFTFEGGTLTASNIEMLAHLIVGSSGQAGRISNAGFFKLSGTLGIGDANELLGRFVLASNSIVNLSGTASRLSFAFSGNESWNSGAHLIVSNWNGSASGGAAEQLKFGNSAIGLTAAQLSQVRFINPAGFAAGLYFAQILSTGEIVPAPRASLTHGRQGDNLVLSWPTGWTLETATNVAGPFVEMPSATSPHTNGMIASPHRFFRLKQ